MEGSGQLCETSSVSETTVIVTLCMLMDFSKHIDTISMGLPIVTFKGSQVEFSKL